MKKVIQTCKTILIAAVLCPTILLASAPTVHAQESSFDLEQEISEKRAAGITVYELYTDDGDIMGYFEPLTEANVMAMAGYAADITYRWNCTLDSNQTGTASSSHSFIQGDTIIIDISQNPTGCISYVGLYDNDTGTYGFPASGSTINGWSNGRLTVGYTGHFSLAIRNASFTTVHYEGYYAF
jgi:hypothetical protein